MALTTIQENALLALLDEPMVSLNELPRVTNIDEQDLFLTRQDTVEKAVTSKVLKDYFAAAATLEKIGTVQLTNSISNDNQTMAVTPMAVSLFAEYIAPVGIPLPWPTETPPTGYLKCNGAAFDLELYPKLALAYPSGILPDLRGEFIRGWDDGRGADVGRKILSWQGDAIRNITGHSQHLHVQTVGVAAGWGGAINTVKQTVINSANNGGSVNGCQLAFDASKVVPTAADNRPRNIAFLYIVRAA